MGWRHFQVANRKNQGKLVFAELVAACDPAVRFWLNAKVLKNRQLWASGWQTLHEIKELAAAYEANPSSPLELSKDTESRAQSPL